MYERLSGQDASFLHMERPETPMHVGSLAIFEGGPFFDGGGRFRCELTDVDPATVAIGGRVEMTFRKISTANGVHNYFWKARPVSDHRGA